MLKILSLKKYFLFLTVAVIYSFAFDAHIALSSKPKVRNGGNSVADEEVEEQGGPSVRFVKYLAIGVPDEKIAELTILYGQTLADEVLTGIFGKNIGSTDRKQPVRAAVRAVFELVAKVEGKEYSKTIEGQQELDLDVDGVIHIGFGIVTAWEECVLNLGEVREAWEVKNKKWKEQWDQQSIEQEKLQWLRKQFKIKVRNRHPGLWEEYQSTVLRTVRAFAEVHRHFMDEE